MQWLRDRLGIIAGASERAALAARADPRQRLYLVPGFAGLGAPYWAPQARGALIGLTADCGPAEIARAALEAVGYQTRDLVEAMAADTGMRRAALRVDGGMAASDWTMQFLADILPAEVERPASVETTAWGAAYVAGLMRGVYPDPEARPRGGGPRAGLRRKWRQPSARSVMPAGVARSPACLPRRRPDPRRKPMTRMEEWPSLPLAEWRETCATLHLWTQVVGKIRLAQAPPVNHWWQVPLYVTSRGLTTSPIPYGGAQLSDRFRFHRSSPGDRASDGAMTGLRAAAARGRRFLCRGDAPAARARSRHPDLDDAGRNPRSDPVRATTATTPPTTPNTPTASGGCWRRPTGSLPCSAARFLGKASPVHFFWGSFDLAVTRFSGRRGAAASGRAQHRRPGHPRGLFARGQQLRFLAGRRRVASSRSFMPTPIRSRPGFAEAAASARPRPITAREFGEFILPYEAGAAGARPRPGLARFPADHLRGRRRSGPSGTAPALERGAAT